MTFRQFDVVVVPFPFTDLPVRLRRPAVVISGADFAAATGRSCLAMVTSALRSTWPGDVAVSDLATAGLSRPCFVRMKLFTLVNDLIVRRVGRLASHDADNVQRAVAALVRIETPAGDGK